MIVEIVGKESNDVEVLWSIKKIFELRERIYFESYYNEIYEYNPEQINFTVTF